MSEGETAPAYRLWRLVTQEQQARGWNTVDLAKRAGVHRNTIARMRTNKSVPLTETVNALARVLGIPIREAFEAAGLDPETAVVETPASKDVEDVEGSAADKALEELLAQIPERRRLELERIRMEERERYKRLLAEAREEYERSLSRIERILRTELETHDPEA